MTVCAPLCGLVGVRKVTRRPSSQTTPWQKRVAGVRHPVNSAQPKVTGEPGGRKKCRIKRGGRKRPSARETPPRRAGRGFSIGGRDFHFLLWQVAGIRKFRKKPQCFALSQGGSRRWFSEILQKSTRGSFFTLWDQVGGQFFLCSYNHHDTAGSRRGCAEFDPQKTKKKYCHEMHQRLQ